MQGTDRVQYDDRGRAKKGKGTQRAQYNLFKAFSFHCNWGIENNKNQLNFLANISSETKRQFYTALL